MAITPTLLALSAEPEDAETSQAAIARWNELSPMTDDAVDSTTQEEVNRSITSWLQAREISRREQESRLIGSMFMPAADDEPSTGWSGTYQRDKRRILTAVAAIALLCVAAAMYTSIGPTGRSKIRTFFLGP